MRGLPLDRVARVRALDARWSAHTGMSGELLVEHAGHACARAILARYPEVRRVAVVCGPGNNGADGYVIARHLAIAGREVRAIALLPPRTPEAILHADVAARMGLLTPTMAGSDPELVVDAVLGTGQRGPLPWSGAIFDPSAWDGRGLAAPSRNALPGSVAPPPRVAIDVPTGLDADSGARLGDFADPAFILVIGRLKPFVLTSTVPWSFVDLGFDLLGDDAISEVVWCERGPAAVDWPVEANKWSRGHVGVRAGSASMAGAAVLACRGALRMGAGLVTLFIEPEAWPRLGSLPPEVMLHPPGALLGAAGDRCDAFVLGPGLGRTADDEVRTLWATLTRPVVVDADALTALATRRDPPAGPRLLTPHAGEAARLLCSSRAGLEADRISATRALRAIAPSILKGVHPLITGAPILALRGGVPQLGTGGSGDVLSGACGAVLARAAVAGAFLDARGADIVQARIEACAAVAVAAHLEAGRRAGPVGVTASEIADALVASEA